MPRPEPGRAPQRVLVTGASGFLGRPCVRALAARGYEVHAVSSGRLAEPVPGGSGGCVRWHALDLLEPDAPARLLAATRPAVVLHLAWLATPGEFWQSPENARWVEASARLYRAAAAVEVSRLVGVGTCAEYGRAEGICDERTTPSRPDTPYGAAKNASREDLEQVAREHGLDTAWARIFAPYGPGEHPRRLIPSVIASLVAGEPALCSAGTQRRDFLHVADVAAALAALLASPVRGVVNVGSGDAVSVAEVVTRIGDRLGARDRVRLGARPMAAGEPEVMVAGVRRLREEVGCRPSLSLDDGLAETIDWWKQRVVVA